MRMDVVPERLVESWGWHQLFWCLKHPMDLVW